LGEKTLRNKWINKYPDKCFSLSDRAAPLPLNHGVYTNAARSFLYRGRTRTGGYTLYPDDYLNPYIESHRPREADYEDKKYLLSFVGRSSHRVRQKIFELSFARQDVYIEDSSHFQLWEEGEQEKLMRQRYFYDML
jgi:hypothetical protein